MRIHLEGLLPEHERLIHLSRREGIHAADQVLTLQVLGELLVGGRDGLRHLPVAKRVVRPPLRHGGEARSVEVLHHAHEIGTPAGQVEARQMVEAADRADVRLAVVSQHRWRDAPRAAKEIIASGSLGQLRMLRVQSTAVGWW